MQIMIIMELLSVRTETFAIALNHCEGLKAQLVEWLKIMLEDPNFAPAEWVMESMWTRIDLLEKFISSLDHDEDPESL